MAELQIPKLRILIADDHAILRDGLAVLINAQADMEVVAQAACGRDAVRLAESTIPDLAVLDVSMPYMGGAEAAERIREMCPSTRVLALTRHANHGYLRRLLAAGARGYVLKKTAADMLIAAIRVVAQGGTYLDPNLGGDVLAGAFGRRNLTPDAQERTFLTEREEEVLRSVAWGRTSKDIAASLGISSKTVESYKATAAEKLHLRTRTDILRYALSRGWLDEDIAPE